jgi:hypothetical protein
MNASQFWFGLLAALLPVIPAIAQARADSVILRVTSPRGDEVAFSGVITLKDEKAERKIEHRRTPFEIRLAAQDIDARFTADDGGALSGEITPFRGDRKMGHVSGVVRTGAVLLHFVPGQSFGFGGRRLAQRLLP